jgi:hypothetical protein
LEAFLQTDHTADPTCIRFLYLLRLLRPGLIESTQLRAFIDLLFRVMRRPATAPCSLSFAAFLDYFVIAPKLVSDRSAELLDWVLRILERSSGAENRIPVDLTIFVVSSFQHHLVLFLRRTPGGQLPTLFERTVDLVAFFLSQILLPAFFPSLALVLQMG